LKAFGSRCRNRTIIRNKKQKKKKTILTKIFLSVSDSLSFEASDAFVIIAFSWLFHYRQKLLNNTKHKIFQTENSSNEPFSAQANARSISLVFAVAFVSTCTPLATAVGATLGRVAIFSAALLI
jgi:uncharacterized membrane protein